MQLTHKAIIGKAGLALASLALLGLAASRPAQAQGFSVNAADSPALQTWNSTEAGWLVTPDDSFTLTNIVSNFNYDLFGQGYITCSVYANNPAYLGGVLLTSGSSVKNDPAGEITFNMNAPTSITAGDTYFIDFTGIYGLGINVTDAPGATKPGTEYYTLNGQHGSDNSDLYDQPILSLNGATAPVPEASTTVSFGLLLCLGLGGLAWSVRRRKAQAGE